MGQHQQDPVEPPPHLSSSLPPDGIGYLARVTQHRSGVGFGDVAHCLLFLRVMEEIGRGFLSPRGYTCEDAGIMLLSTRPLPSASSARDGEQRQAGGTELEARAGPDPFRIPVQSLPEWTNDG